MNEDAKFILFFSLFLLAIVSVIINVIYKRKLLSYLREKKSSLLESLTLKREFTPGLFGKLPVGMRLKSSAWVSFIFSRNKEEDKMIARYKRGYLVSLIMFVLFVIACFLYNSFVFF